ncbi:ribosome biogenesis GTP-binding protein YihA/YsxC [Buchnera aphidicola]|uniref:ribosome biogenesis GTP-binding protein YihA/YsxC n=1 Tax=Buchnera aphidicola TaxID=9 RepID=UPI00094DA29F|nr:ribosome biogenesis GTP-binding protein YihA/YsxC [Buchnera aphidicola]
MKKLIFSKTTFLKSGLDPHDWLTCVKMEVALLGYSNVGKSSVINVLTNQKKLAHISKSPGRTRLINFFEIVPDFRIIDLPGYGYSKISNQYKYIINKNIMKFLQHRPCLKGIILLSDIRFPLKNLDLYILNLINQRFLPIILLLTKSDKSSRRFNILQYRYVYKELKKLKIKADIIIFSSIKKIGVSTLQKKLSLWWNFYKN